jgi:photosystem II stability/assembly factor-like uncharacterized protein
MVDQPSTAHIRGVQALSDELVWLSGSAGTVMKSEDGGKSWKNISVPNCEKLDFRDIHAINTQQAWVMSSGNGGRIYYTANGGEEWQLQFEDTNQKVFFDGLDFYDAQNGIAFGDPINGVLDVLITNNGGKKWKRLPTTILPKTIEGEAGFAASGTGIVNKGQCIWIATGGGATSRIFKSKDNGQHWSVYNTPIIGGKGAGIFSMAFKDDKNGVVVGGNYLDSINSKYNCAYTTNGGESWELIESNGPKGYRSCVTITEKGLAIACGRTGIDLSNDFINWKTVSEEGFYTCDAGKNVVWLAGRRGKVGKLVLE